MQRGACAAADLLAGVVTLQGPALEQPAPEGLHSVEGTRAGAAQEELQPVEGIYIGEVCGGLISVGVTPHWNRGRA